MVVCCEALSFSRLACSSMCFMLLTHDGGALCFSAVWDRDTTGLESGVSSSTCPRQDLEGLVGLNLRV